MTPTIAGKGKRMTRTTRLGPHDWELATENQRLGNRQELRRKRYYGNIGANESTEFVY
jgi:hypothetical protein